MSEFAERLKQSRQRKKVTQQQIADILGIDRTTVTHWEKGRNTPNPNQLAKIASYLGVSADYLLGLEKETWLYQLPDKLISFVREEALQDKPSYLELAPEIKKSGIKPETVKILIAALLKEIKDSPS